MTSGGARSGVTLNALWVPVLPETAGLSVGIEKAAVGARMAWDRVTKGMGSAMAGELKRNSEQGVVSLSQVSAAYKKVEADKIAQVSASNALSKAERDLDTARSAGVAKATELAAVQQKINQGVLEGEAADKKLAAANDAVAGAYNRVATAAERSQVAQMKNLTATKELTTSSKAAADANDALAASQTRSAGAMRALNTTGAVAFFGVAAGLAEAGKAAANFEYSQMRLVASAGETHEGLKVVSDGLLQMAGQVGYTADELSKGMYIVESAGFHGADGLKVMQAAAQGAKAEQADLTTVNNGLTTSLHDFHLTADQAPDVMSKMVAAVGQGKTTFEEFAGALHSVEPVAGAANLKLEDIYSTLAMMTRTGMSADQATENMRNSINALMNPTQQMRDEMGKWGISADDVKEKLSERGLAGTMQYLTGTVFAKMGPAQQSVVSDMYENAQATQAAKQMLDAMSPAARAVAEQFQAGTMTRKEYLAAVKGSSAADSAQLQQFGALQLKIEGYSSNLKKGQSTVETYDQAVKTMTGTVAGQTVALAVSGDNAKDTNALLANLNGTNREADGTVKGFNETQKTAKARWDDMRAAMHSARIEIGQAVLPALSGLADGLKDSAQFLAQHEGLTTTLIATVGTLGVVWAGWKIAMGTKALYTGIAEGVGALARNVSLARDATWGLNDASVAAEGSTARAGGAAATAAGEQSLLADAGGRASVSEGLLAGTASAAAGAETRAAAGAGIAAGAEAGLVGAGAGAAASTGVLAGAATGLAVGLRGIAGALPTIAAFAALTGPLDHLLEKLPGLGDILKKGEDLTGTGFSALEPWKWKIWDQMSEPGHLFNPFGDKPKPPPPPPVQFSGSTVPDSGAGPQQLFPGSPFAIPAASDWAKAVGQAVISLPNEHTITIKNNSKDVMDNLKRLGIEVHELPDGRVELEAETADAAKSFQDWVKDTTGKPIEVKVKAKPTNKDNSNWFGFPEDFKKLFGIDDNNPVQIPATLAPVSSGGGLPFVLPPAGSSGGVTPANPAAPGGPPPAPPPGVAPPAGSGGLGDILLPSGGGVPGRGGGAPGGYVGAQRDVGGPEAWRGTVRSILATVGPSFGITNMAAWEDAIIAQIRTESGGNWAAKNNTDSNATAGHPSQGILQFVPGTYDAWTAKTPFAGRPFPDPYAEIAAAIPYVLEKYGTRPDGGPNHIGQGIGFNMGGPVGFAGGGFMQADPRGFDPHGGTEGGGSSGSFAPWWDMDWMPPEHPEKVGPSLPGVQGKWWGRGPTGKNRPTPGGHWAPPIGKNRLPLPGDFYPGMLPDSETKPYGFQTGGWVDVGGGLGQVANPVIDPVGWANAKSGMKKLALNYWATKAAQAEGVDVKRAVPALLDVIYRESGSGSRGLGDPNIVNLWDSNAKKGDPSIGFAQVTQGTVDDPSNANMPGADLSDPITNLRAALRHVASRGINIWDVPEARGQQVGYQEGGEAGGGISDHMERKLIEREKQILLQQQAWAGRESIYRQAGYQGGGSAGDEDLPFIDLTDPDIAAVIANAKARQNLVQRNVIPWIKPLEHADGGFAGHVEGAWTPGRDSIHAILEQGEFVTQRSRAQHILPLLRWSNNAPVDQLQKMMGLMGFQGGAEVGGGDDVGVTPEILAVEKIANQFGLRLTAGKSGHGTHDTDGGYHDSGEAGDFGNGTDTAQEDAFAAYMIQNYGANLAEVIHTSPQLPKLIKDGQLVDPQQVYGPWLPEHHDHVHVAVKPGAFGAVGGYQAGSASLPTALGPGGMSSVSPMSSGGGGGGGASGYAPSQYPGYWSTPSGSYIPEEDVPNKGTYGGATQSAIDSALKGRDNAAAAIQSANDRITKLEQERDKLLHPEPAYPGAPAPEPAKPDQIAEKDKEIAAAHKAADEAKANAADADAKYTQVLNKPPEPTKGGGTRGGRTSDSNVTGFGGDLVKGAFQELGFDGSVFEDPTQWGIWKLFTSGVNFLGTMGKTIAEKGAPGLGIPPMQAGDQGLPFGIGQGGPAGDLLGGVSSAMGLQLPATDASTVSLQPGAPGGPPAAVSAPGTIQPGGSGMGPGGVGIPNPLDGGGVPNVDFSSHVTFSGVTDTDKLLGHMAGVGIKKSRAMGVGAPNGGVRMI